MTLPQYSKKDFTLTLRHIPVEVKRNEIYEILTNMITRDPKYFYCFWGCYGDPLPADTIVTDYVEIDGKKYAKPAFTVVNGYEKVRLEEAEDSMIYHLPESTYGESGLQPQDVTVKVYATGTNPTSTVQSSTRVTPKEFLPNDAFDNRAYVISTSYYNEADPATGVGHYAFSMIELPFDVSALWTVNNRLGVYVLDIDHDGVVQDKTPEKYKYVTGIHRVR